MTENATRAVMAKERYRNDKEYRKSHLKIKYDKYWSDEEHRERHRKACRERYHKNKAKEESG